jgi:hypothetical protein
LFQHTVDCWTGLGWARVQRRENVCPSFFLPKRLRGTFKVIQHLKDELFLASLLIVQHIDIMSGQELYYKIKIKDGN